MIGDSKLLNNLKKKTLILTSTFILSIFSCFSFAQEVLDQFTDKAAIVVKTLQLVNKQREEQYKMMQLQMQQASLQAYLSPKILSPTNQIFPQCPRPVQNASAPVCMINNTQDLSMAQMIVSASSEHMALYSQNSSPELLTSGLGCLQQAKELQKTFIKEKLNQLTNYEDLLKENIRKFKEKMDLAQRRMDSIKDNLEGGNRAKDVNAENRDFTKDLPNCANIIPGENMVGTSAGLYNIKAAMDKSGDQKKSLISSSANYLNNKTNYENSVDQIKSRLFNQINSSGIDDWTSNFNKSDLTKGGLTLFTPARDAIISKIRKMQVARERIKKRLTSKELLGESFNPPDFDSNFKNEINKKINDTIVFERKKFIQDCVFDDPSKGGKGIGLQNLMSGIKQMNIDGGGTTVSQYKNALNRILTSDSFIQDKLERIKNLEKTYGTVIQVIYKNNTGRRTAETPYSVFKKSVDNCQKFYNSDQSVSANSERIRSKKYRLDKAEKYLNELKDLENNFITEMLTEINDRVINCSGVTLDESKCGEKMSPDSNNFCIKHATTCAQKTQSCYKEAKAFITKATKKLEAEAGLYNKNVEVATKQQQDFLNKVNLFLQNDIAIPLKKRFPTTSFSLPEGLTLQLPELEASEHNVLLRGGGNLDFLQKDLPRKLILLKRAIIEQAKAADKVAEDYIADFQKQMEKAQEDWSNTKTQCAQAISDYQKVQSELKNNMAEEEQKAKEELDEVTKKELIICNKFNKLRENPLGGCDGDFSAASLYKEANEIAYFVTEDARILKDIGDFDNLCALNQNENQNDGERKSDDTPELMKLCKKNGNDWDKAKKSLGREIFDKLSINNPKLSKAEKNHIQSSLGLRKSETSEVELEPKLSNIVDLSKSVLDTKPINFSLNLKKGSTAIYENLKSDIKGFNTKENQDLYKNLRSLLREKDNEKKFNEQFEKVKNKISSLQKKGYDPKLAKLDDDLKDLNAKLEKEKNTPNNEEEKNICTSMDDYLRKKAKSYCEGKTNAGSTCFEDEYSNAQKNLGPYRQLNGQINDLYFSTENSKKAEFNRRWLQLGEEVDNPCITQNENSREPKDMTDIVGEGIEDYINNMDTINR